jgi:hypothetical protein
VQRLFSTFPAGCPGIALLLLRASTATGLLTECMAHYHPQPIWISGASLLDCVALGAGVLTPVAAGIALALYLLMWSSFGMAQPSTAAVLCIDAIALALIGPGAYSFDARRFGRRIVAQTPR